MSAFAAWLELHWAAIFPWVYMGATAAFITMPDPDEPANGRAFYRWFYDAVHQFANLRRAQPQAKRPGNAE
jgi:hypothetical protein